MIRIKRSLISGLKQVTDPAPVCAALQQAIELEHATIPLYLYALYSLDANKNAEIANIIQSVVIEEMLHMTLSSNVLNALGGAPQINKPDFIPQYPGHLPGGVESSLIVNLAPFSMQQLETFLAIEQPENPLQFPSLLATEDDSITIGEFYTAISDAIAQLGNGAFVSPPRNQVGPDLMEESVVVVDVASAQQAIQTIIDQGEGTSTSPEEIVGDEYAHYYRFMQIQKGAALVQNPQTGQYSYTGAPIVLDNTGVYPVPTNPKAANYGVGTIQRFACDNFNYTYTNLLSSLHNLFNGDATSTQLNTAIGLMMSLKGQAKAMMSGIPDPSFYVGPSFEYLLNNPRATP